MNLSKTEKRALLGYLRNPDANPGYLADALDMSYWTLIKTRKKLTESGILRFIWAPDLKRIGAGIVFSGFGAIKKEESAPEVSSDLLFFTAMEDRKGFGIGISRDYSCLYRGLMEFSERYGYLGAESFGITMLPSDMADIWRLADFYPLISHDLHMEVPQVEKEDVGGKTGLKDNEKDVFACIVEHPEWTGEMIARELGTSRQRVLRLRERFQREGLIRRRALVDLRALGYEVLLFVTWTMRPHIYRRMYENLSKYPLSPIILGISTPMQGMAVAAFKSFRESREITEHLSEWAKPEENLIGEPQMLFLSIQDSVFTRYFDFSRPLRKIFNITK